MNIGIIGCGYVFDHYMSTIGQYSQLNIVGVADIDTERAAHVGAFYGLKVYPDNTAMFADPTVDIVVNLTSIESHFEVTYSALAAGKHVFSEKPFATSLEDARELIAFAEKKNLWLSSAPSNALSPSARTMWKAVSDGVIGETRLVYAEFDDSPVYLMSPENWRSRSGAPWPYIHEFEMGCTWEHVGYHLGWMCAMFGPVRAVTAFSKRIVPDKTELPLSPADTPDFSIACLDFENGVVGRITCSISAPLDHRMRIVGNAGMVHTDTYRDYSSPVYLERFSKLSLNARKARLARNLPVLRWLFGIDGRRVPLVEKKTQSSGMGWGPRAMLQRFKRAQLGQQDKCVGIADLADAISVGRKPFFSHDFILHLLELTLLIQAAGPDGGSNKLTTTFKPRSMPEAASVSTQNYNDFAKPKFLDRLSESLLDRLHRH